MKRLMVILAMVVLGGALASSAQASSIVFNLTSGVGNINYIPGNPVIPGNPIKGVDLQVSTITGQGTPSHSGDNFSPSPPEIKVSFTTGALTNSNASHWFFTGGGSIIAAFTDTTYLTGAFLDSLPLLG